MRDAGDNLRHTPGRLYAGDLELYTLELPWWHNLARHSCIPTGTYEVIYVPSARYRRCMPRLVEVPGRYGILIHPGNTEHDTEGCILVGTGRAADETVTNSRAAFEEFVDWLVEALGRGPVGVEITKSGVMPEEV